MGDRWTGQLSAYLDDELDQGERDALTAHLAACADCTATLDELRRVVGRARALDDRPPATDLWPGIADRIGLSADELAVRRRARERRFVFTVPQLVAAGLALAVVSVSVAWLALRGDRQPVAGSPGLPSAIAPAAQSVKWMPKVEKSSEAAVTELRMALVEGRRTGRLDALTVAKLERSLAVIDSAIAEATRALESDPGSAYLNHHLADTYRRKLSFLRQATRLAAAQT